MNTNRHGHFFGITVLLGLALSVGVLVAGCGQPPQDTPADEGDIIISYSPVESPDTAAQPAVAPAGAAPEAAAPATTGDTAAAQTVSADKPAKAKPAAKTEPRPEADFVRLYKLQQEYIKNGPHSKSADESFKEKWEDLTVIMTPKTLIDGLDILAVDTRQTGPKELTFSFLLHTTKDLEEDYHLRVTGRVKREHVQFVEPSKPEANYRQWAVLLRENPTSQWKAGEFHVATLKAETEIVPFKLSVLLQTRDAQGRWTGDVGKAVDLGWHTADTPDFVRLAAMQQDYRLSGNSSNAIEEAFKERWKALTTEMIPKTLVDGLDLLAVDTRVTAPKQYTLSFLLHTTDKLEEDYHLTITGAVDPSHVQYIKPTRPGGRSVEWNIFLFNDRTSQWSPGTYWVVQLDVDTEIIPYDMSVRLHTRDAERRWAGSAGNTVKLGWQADIKSW